MTAHSAGILLYRQRPSGELQVFLIHMGGPYWSHKDAGAWSIPKGEYGGDEAPLQAARREFEEETGLALDGPFLPLETIKQRNGKQVAAWAVRGDFDPAQLRCNLFSLEWPPRSGKMQQFPEADRCDWFSPADARLRMIAGQGLLLDRLLATIGEPVSPTGAIVELPGGPHESSNSHPTENGIPKRRATSADRPAEARPEAGPGTGQGTG